MKDPAILDSCAANPQVRPAPEGLIRQSAESRLQAAARPAAARPGFRVAHAENVKNFRGHFE
jgi:hypothetical protein